MADKSHWISGTQALAALTTALVAVGAFLGFSHGGKDREALPPAAPAAGPAPAPAPVAAQQVSVTPVRAVLSIGGEADRPVANAVLTVRIRNNGQVPIGVAWLDARRGAAFDLDNGAHLTGHGGTAFTGLPDCDHRRPGDCNYGDTTTLVPGEETLATLTLGSRTDADARPRLAAAKSGTLTARLSIRPGRKADAYAQPVSLADMALVNNIR